MGTPKTLEEAILNGLLSTKESPVVDRIKEHVKDFLSQKFTIAVIKPMPSMDLWHLLFPEDRK